MLELAAELKTDGELAPHLLGPDDRCYRKHFLDLGGNGVRDLHRHGDDLLILAGPTASIDGRCSIWRWRDAWGEEADSYTVGDRLQQLIRIPVGVDADHPEGIHVLPGTDGRELMVVYDAREVAPRGQRSRPRRRVHPAAALASAARAGGRRPPAPHRPLTAASDDGGHGTVRVHRLAGRASATWPQLRLPRRWLLAAAGAAAAAVPGSCGWS